MVSTRAVTLGELLIGLAVLFILFVLLFPSPASVGLDPAPKAQARNDVTQIVAAVTAYETEYGRFPTNSGTVSGEVLEALRGKPSPLNPREIVFLEAQTAKKGRSGIANGTFVDPWGGPYQIACDTDANGRVTAGTNAISVPEKIAVWNDPRLGNKGWFVSAQKLARRSVTSWP